MDDLSLTAVGEEEDEVVDVLYRAYAAGKRLFTIRTGLNFSPQKAHLLATTEALAKKAAAMLEIPIAAVAEQVRRLGLD